MAIYKKRESKRRRSRWRAAFRRYAVACLIFCWGASGVDSIAQTVVLFDEDDVVGADYRDGSSGTAEGGDILTLLNGNRLPITTSAYTGASAGLLEYAHTFGGRWEMVVFNDGGVSADLRGADSVVVYVNAPTSVAGRELPRLALVGGSGQQSERVWLSVPQNVLKSSSSGFRDGATTNAVLSVEYIDTLPASLRRPGYPEDLVITFADIPLDTSLAAIGAPATPSHFMVNTEGSGLQLDFRFRDLNGDGTLSAAGEYIDVLTPNDESGTSQSPTWRFTLASVPGDLVSPGEGDVYDLKLVFSEFAIDDDPGTWQRLAYPMLDFVASTDLLANVTGVAFHNGGETSETRTLWFDRVEVVTNDDEAFMEDVMRLTFDFFWETTEPSNGLVPDKVQPGSRRSSIASTGFGLSAYTVGIDHGWITREQGIGRVLNTLRFFWNAPQSDASTNVTGYKGFFYHFLNMDTGYRQGTNELSTIDTALLLGGIIHAREYFDGESAAEEEIRALADSIYYRVDWQWAANNAPLVTLAWSPENGFSNFDWRGYNEAMIIYLLGIGSPTYPLDPAAWDGWTSTYRWETHYGFSFVRFPPLFGHQYSHVWYDFRGIQDDYMRDRRIDYFENSRRATLAQRAYHIANPRGWRNYSRDEWGLTASEYPDGYIARGAPPAQNDEGTITPTAPGGSVPFAPDETIAALRTIKRKYPAMYGTYGFKDAYNASRFWFSENWLGIDQGPILLMMENHRTGAIWDRFMQNEDVQRGLTLAGFRPTPINVEDNADEVPRERPALVSVFPNPARESVTIRVATPASGGIRLDAYDALGRRVAEIRSDYFAAGVHDVTWDSSALANGVYFVRMTSGSQVATRTVVLFR